MKGSISIIASLITATMLPTVSTADGASASLGFNITSCRYDASGVCVSWQTDQDPPYEVGVYRLAEIGIGREFPIAYVETDDCFAYLKGDFTDTGVFVQCAKKGSLGVVRTLTKDEVASYDDFVKGHGGKKSDAFKFVPSWNCYGSYTNFTISSVSSHTNIVRTYNILNVNVTDGASGLVTNTDYTTFVATNKILVTADESAPRIVNNKAYSLKEPVHLSLISDYKWRGFLKGDEDRLTVALQGRRFDTVIDSIVTNTYPSVSIRFTGSGVNDYIYVTNIYTRVTTNKHWKAHTVTTPYFTITNDNPVATGWRITYKENDYIESQRAYSSDVNRSEELIIPRSFVAYSSHNGYIYTIDYYGREISVPSPYTKDDYLYMKGLSIGGSGLRKNEEPPDIEIIQ